MKDLYVCNVSSNYISKINVSKDMHEKIYIQNTRNPIGIHGIDFYNKRIYVATNNSEKFYEFNMITRNVKSRDIGMMTNDLRVIDGLVYLICSENNCLTIYDLSTEGIFCLVQCGNYPHSMDVHNTSKIISITNMHNNQITLVDYSKNESIKNIRTGNLPMNSKFHKDGKHIIVCESNLGSDINGSLSIYNFHTGNRENSINLNKSPIDMFVDYDSDVIFVSNYLGDCISIIDLIEFKEIKRIEVSGNPRGLYRLGRFLYIVLSDREALLKYDLYTQYKKFIKIGEDSTCIYAY